MFWSSTVVSTIKRGILRAANKRGSSMRNGCSNRGLSSNYAMTTNSATRNNSLCRANVIFAIPSSPIKKALTLQMTRICSMHFTIRGLRTSMILDETHDIVCPAFAESISEGTLIWEKEKGDSIAVDDVICEIETDKTTVTVPSPVSGIIEELLVDNEATVNPGTVLARISVGEAGSAPAPTAEVPPMKGDDDQSPVARMPRTDPNKEIAGTRSENRVKMSRMRSKIAARLKEAQNTNAMLTTFNEVDMSNIINFRKQNQEAFIKRNGIKLGFMSMFVKASAYALQQIPTVNAVIDGTEIVYRDYIDISIAVATEKGLVVPVLRNIVGKNFADIEKEIASVAEKAKKNELNIEDMEGGTFTITNGGTFGSLFGTPIINPPQSAILGMHGTFERPVAHNGEVVIRPMMYIALTYDHRLIDGADAVTFLKTIKLGCENPYAEWMKEEAYL